MKKLAIILALSCSSFFSYAEKIRLVIDAAHGGNDAGAVSASGDKESAICMQFAQALADYAKAQHIEVTLTRSSDEQAVPLDQRIKYTVENGVKTYFISFHTDKSKDINTRGGSVMYSGQNPDAAGSKALAEIMAANLNRLNDIGTMVKENNSIVVLRNNPAPAVAISVGFISNKTDLIKLKDAATQKELAALIVKSLID